MFGGVKQLLGMGRTEKFTQIMAAMGSAFFTRRICLLGGGIMAVTAITMVAAAAWLAADRGAPRRRVLAAHLGFAFCFAALYLFHLILYNYNFSDLEDWLSRTMTAIWPLLSGVDAGDALPAGARRAGAAGAAGDGGAAAVILPYSAGAVCPRRASGPVPTACTRCAPTCRTAPTR
ncbi:hypothetical protein NIA69_05705 [Gemmiger formicilis]|nr:hypothetical protein [Gemmiger formicilis]